MRTIGFPISHKENENRRALLPSDICNIRNKSSVFVEQGYGQVLSICDQEYVDAGVRVVSREEVLSKDVICDPKIGDAEYLDALKEGQIIFGWVHAVQNRDITDKIIKARATAIAWEDMFYKGKHIFWRNNEIAGEAAVMHAYSLYGLFPYDTKVALLGNGNVARGAYRILVSLGAEVVQYNRHTEQLLRDELDQYDVIVNAILWDTNRTDHIIYRKDLKRMKSGTLIIDISCDRNGGIETSVPTTIDNPIYTVNGVVHYVVDHTPSIFHKTISKELSKIVSGYVDALVSDNMDEVLLNARCINNGLIADNRINVFQNRKPRT
ncbi:MAG: N(5)-(carboxyethyl)ornithine synthase [Bacteroidales bacterium]|nr:N(5)-(carboxyethyl)ornithine synthase [Bacteroidales bacterium]